MAEVASYRSLRYTMAVQPALSTSCSSFFRSSPRGVQLIMHQYYCIMFLHVHRCVHCRAGISHAIFQRRFAITSIRKMPIVLLTNFIVYHWASITGGRYGRSCGWFAGWWNFLGWLVGTSSMSFILGNQTVSMYAAFHPALVVQRWHVFVSYLICTWICCATVLFANRALPVLGTLGIYIVVVGVAVTIVVCAVMPHVNGTPYALNASVWADWDNRTGYSSDGFVFLAGMLNGAYAVGCPDCVSHLAEEIPK